MKKNYRTQPSVVCIGGGTGLSTMLRGLKLRTDDITAIVTVADDGGGSGMLREELGMLPPGDIRNCILALSNAEPIMEAVIGYRFTEGSLKGQSFGNLALAALNNVTGSFVKAVETLCQVLAITGKVLPVTDEDVRLKAEFEDGATILGESRIFEAKKEHHCRIKKVELLPERPRALSASLKAIDNADLIIFGPGSLYTSIIPNLLVEGVAKHVVDSPAMKLYVANLMTQEGETDDYSAEDHVTALFNHAGMKIFDMCLSNNAIAPESVIERYAEKGAGQIFVNDEEMGKLGVRNFSDSLAVWENGYVRHDPVKLADAVMELYRQYSPTRYYVSPSGRKYTPCDD